MIRINNTARLALLSITSSVILGAGIGTAVGSSSGNSTTSADDIRRVAVGVSPSGKAYEVRTVPDPYDGVCFELVVAGVGTASGCLPPPEDDGLSATQVLLFEDQYLVAVGREDARALQVARSNGKGRAASRGSLAIGPRRLLHAAMPVAEGDLPRTDFGLPVPPPVDFTVTDSSGAVVAKERVAVPLDSPHDGAEHGHAAGSQHTLPAE